MKCIKYSMDGKIVRVTDKIADDLVYSAKAKFISKLDWKTQVRDIQVIKPVAIMPEVEVETVLPVEKPKKKHKVLTKKELKSEKNKLKKEEKMV